MVEMLVTVAIMASLVAMASGIYVVYVRDSDEKTLKYDLSMMRHAIQQFYFDHGRYPYDGRDRWGNEVRFLDSGTSELTQGVCSGPSYQYPPNRRRYLERIPVDPTTNLPNWKLIGYDNDGDGKIDEDPIDSVDNDGDGATDEDPKDVCDVRSSNPRFSDW